MPITFWSGVFNKDKKEDKRTNDNVTYVTSTTTIRPTVTQNPSTTKGNKISETTQTSVDRSTEASETNITTTKNNPNSTTTTSLSPTRETVPTTLTQINWADFIGIKDDKPDTSKGTDISAQEPEKTNKKSEIEHTYGFDENGNKTDKWIEENYEYTKTTFRDGSAEITRREIPGNRPGATYSVNENGETVETWVENGTKFVKTFLKNGNTRTVSSNAEPSGWRKIWTDNGTKYIEYYDGYGNLIKTDKIFVSEPTPTTTTSNPNEKKPWDASSRSHYTPQELQGEAYRQYNDWNAYRQSKGMKAGVWDEQFSNEAQKWADKLAKEDNGTGKFYDIYPHERDYVLSGKDPLYNQQYVRLYGGENVWMTDAFNLQEALDKFINSPGHNRNLLTQEQPGQFLRMGIGIAKGENKDWNGRTPYYIVYKMR